jgi:hypothetical protein
LTYRKKPKVNDSTGNWAPRAVARFPDRESRDRFIRSVSASEVSAWDAKPVDDDDRGAWVRWRVGHFLSLNDMAYTQHGRINIAVIRRRA